MHGNNYSNNNNSNTNNIGSVIDFKETLKEVQYQNNQNSEPPKTITKNSYFNSVLHQYTSTNIKSTNYVNTENARIYNPENCTLEEFLTNINILEEKGAFENLELSRTPSMMFGIEQVASHIEKYNPGLKVLCTTSDSLGRRNWLEEFKLQYQQKLQLEGYKSTADKEQISVASIVKEYFNSLL